jgi:hypothetical protein
VIFEPLLLCDVDRVESENYRKSAADERRQSYL